LLRRLAQQISAHAEGREQLIVQVVAIRQHNQRRVRHGRVFDDLARVEGHQQALSRTLRMPDHPDFAVSILGGRGQGASSRK
jgi:hypothetical protein